MMLIGENIYCSGDPELRLYTHPKRSQSGEVLNVTYSSIESIFFNNVSTPIFNLFSADDFESGD